MENVYIIAEAGVNHNGDIEIAKSLVNVAKKSGADAVKFQTFDTSKLVKKDISKADYQSKNTKDSKETQYDMLKKLELKKSEFKELKAYCDKCAIDFLSTPFDLDSLDFLVDLNVKKIKIPSGEISNLPFIWKIAKKDKPIIMSTGMSDLSEIENAVATIFHSQNNDKEPSSMDEILEICKKEISYTLNSNLSLLHCTSQYPAPLDELNLNCIEMLSEKFGLNVGYSDHSDGIEVSLAAVAKGAKIIEKHFTLDKNLQGPDHKASLEPNELKNMIDGIRKIERALGNNIKRVQNSELDTQTAARQQLIASKPIKKGDIFKSDDFSTRRCGTGIAPFVKWELIGKPSNHDYEEGDLIKK